MDQSLTHIQSAYEFTAYNALAGVSEFIPQLVAALILVLFGHLVSRWTKWLTIKLVRAMHLEKLIKDSPVDAILGKLELIPKIESYLGGLVRWFVLFIFVIGAVNVLQLTTVSSFLTQILSYLPRILAAIVILVFGAMVAGFVESLVKHSLAQISLSTARLTSKFTSYIVMIFTLLAALAQLGIAENLIYILFIGFVATLSLSLGLAFGLGAKDLIAQILDEWYSKLKQDHE